MKISNTKQFNKKPLKEIMKPDVRKGPVDLKELRLKIKENQRKFR